MYVVLLRFADNANRAGEFIDGHNAWVERGFAEGVFLLVGSLRSGGGGILAHNTSAAALERRVAEDPFVAENVVAAEIVEVTPGRADERLGFLMAPA
jgi:uncharacterized protein YciI